LKIFKDLTFYVQEAFGFGLLYTFKANHAESGLSSTKCFHTRTSTGIQKGTLEFPKQVHELCSKNTDRRNYRVFWTENSWGDSGV